MAFNWLVAAVALLVPATAALAQQPANAGAGAGARAHHPRRRCARGRHGADRRCRAAQATAAGRPRENWEDTEQFQPYLYVDVSDQTAKWRELVSSYEFVRGGISSFAYLDYYTALATVRGAEARRRQAVAFDIDPLGKRRVLDSVP